MVIFVFLNQNFVFFLGWQEGKQYTYSVKTKTLSAIHQVSNQFTGIFTNAKVLVQLKSSNILMVKVNSQ